MAKSKDSDSTLFAFLGVLFTVIGFVLVLLARKNDKYAMHYAKQGLVLFFALIVASAGGWVLGWLPLIGGFLGGVIWVLWVIAWVIGLIYSFSGELKEIPVIGSFAKKINV